MPRGCKWHFVGAYVRDDPGMRQSWEMYVARNSAGRFYVKAVGEETQIEGLATSAMLVGFFEDYGKEYLKDLRKTACNVAGFEDVIRMMDFRLRDRRRLSMAAVALM